MLCNNEQDICERMLYYKIVVSSGNYAYFIKNHRYFVEYFDNEPNFFLCRYVFFVQSTDPVNDLIVAIKYVISLLNSKVSKTLVSLNSTIAILVQTRDNLSFLFIKRYISN